MVNRSIHRFNETATSLEEGLAEDSFVHSSRHSANISEKVRRLAMDGNLSPFLLESFLSQSNRR